MGYFSIAVLVATMLLGSGSTTSAQGQYSKVLLGKWEGQVRYETERLNPARTLIVESVEGEGAVAVKGQFGITGQDLSQINGTFETTGRRPQLRFTTSDSSSIVLDLQGEKALIGTINFPGFPGRAMQLWKVK